MGSSLGRLWGGGMMRSTENENKSDFMRKNSGKCCKKRISWRNYAAFFGAKKDRKILRKLCGKTPKYAGKCDEAKNMRRKKTNGPQTPPQLGRGWGDSEVRRTQQLANEAIFEKHSSLPPWGGVVWGPTHPPPTHSSPNESLLTLTKTRATDC